MLNYYQKLKISTPKAFTVCDVTEDVGLLVRESGVLEGMITITSFHTTCALSVSEKRIFDDIRNFFLTLTAPEVSYKHNDLHLRVNISPDEPENTHSHLIAMLLGNSEVLVTQIGELTIGRYQSILLLEMDGPRERTLVV